MAIVRIPSLASISWTACPSLSAAGLKPKACPTARTSAPFETLVSVLLRAAPSSLTWRTGLNLDSGCSVATLGAAALAPDRWASSGMNRDVHAPSARPAALATLMKCRREDPPSIDMSPSSENLYGRNHDRRAHATLRRRLKVAGKDA